MTKASRNDPCPCGSGKKYKKCCLAKEKESPLKRISAKVIRDQAAIGQQFIKPVTLRAVDNEEVKEKEEKSSEEESK